jgi:ssDNA-binding replication factor A large subunit
LRLVGCMCAAVGKANARFVCFAAVGSTHQIKDGSVVRKCRVADKTGSVSFSLWNEQAEAIEAGDILRLING